VTHHQWWPVRVDRRLNLVTDDPGQRGCLGKTMHPSLESAEASRRAQGARYYELHAYRCPRCERWHLGHKGRG
jgi:hypothetical protein